MSWLNERSILLPLLTARRARVGVQLMAFVLVENQLQNILPGLRYARGSQGAGTTNYTAHIFVPCDLSARLR